MKDDIEKLRAALLPALQSSLPRFPHFRLGLVLYRDYVDNFRFEGLPIRIFQFTTYLEEFMYGLNSFTILGVEGGDRPEAVYEALYAALEYYHWAPGAFQKIILIGDAEPHPRPRGSRKYSRELIEQMIRSTQVTIDTIILPKPGDGEIQ